MRKRILLCGLLLAAVCVALAGTAMAKAPYTFKFATSWNAADGRIAPSEQPKSPYWQYVAQKVGVVPLIYGFEWGGGAADYAQAMRMSLAAGDKYDLITLRDQALTRELIQAGRLLPLDNLLPLYASNIWKLATKEQWDLVRALAPDRKIYFIPQWLDKKMGDLRGSLLRKDWLDKFGMKVPTTKDELLAYYRAVKDKDPNGNGLKDEIPVSGRAGLRWCDDLFMMWGASSLEGYPQWRWDAKKKVMICDQVSNEMKNAISFMRDLVKEGLMDKEFITASRADWVAKISSGRVGHYFHLAGAIDEFMMDAVNKNPKVHLVYMPLPRVPGLPKQQGTIMTFGDPIFGFLKDTKAARQILKLMNWAYSTEGDYYGTLGIPGVDWTRQADGTIKIINVMQFGHTGYTVSAKTTVIEELFASVAMGANKLELCRAIIADGGYWPPANDGMPVTIYDGYQDYAPAASRLYKEYCSKMVMDELPMSAWDEYVKKWYADGGTEVVKRATEWYKKVHNIK